MIQKISEQTKYVVGAYCTGGYYRPLSKSGNGYLDRDTARQKALEFAEEGQSDLDKWGCLERMVPVVETRETYYRYLSVEEWDGEKWTVTEQDTDPFGHERIRGKTLYDFRQWLKEVAGREHWKPSQRKLIQEILDEYRTVFEGSEDD